MATFTIMAIIFKWYLLKKVYLIICKTIYINLVNLIIFRAFSYSLRWYFIPLFIASSIASSGGSTPLLEEFEEGERQLEVAVQVQQLQNQTEGVVGHRDPILQAL